MNKLRVMMIDDDTQRLKTFLSHDFPMLFTYVNNVLDASKIILNGERWNLVLFDHDLGGPSGFDCGMHLVNKFIVPNKPVIDNCVVHSMNPAGRENMCASFQNLGYKTFNAPGSWSNKPFLETFFL